MVLNSRIGIPYQQITYNPIYSRFAKYKGLTKEQRNCYSKINNAIAKIKISTIDFEDLSILKQIYSNCRAKRPI
jgi:hypothetical protein